jgi:hypothetical protein
MPTTYLVALRAGDGVAASLGWYWRLPQRAREAVDAATWEHVERAYGAPVWGLGTEQARAVHDWAAAQHA